VFEPRPALVPKLLRWGRLRASPVVFGGLTVCSGRVDRALTRRRPLVQGRLGERGTDEPFELLAVARPLGPGVRELARLDGRRAGLEMPSGRNVSTVTGDPDRPSRSELAELSTAEVRTLLATTSDSRVARRCIETLPVTPADGTAGTTLPDVRRAVEALDPAPYYGVASYLGRVADERPELLVEHAELLRAVVRYDTNDDNYIETATGPVRTLAAVAPDAAAEFVGALAGALDAEPTGHEGATTILETIKWVLFPVDEADDDRRVSARHLDPGEQAHAVAAHSASVADCLSRQYDPHVHHTSRTATEALVVLHGIAVADPGAVADDHHLQQVVRALGRFGPTTRRYDEACGALSAVAVAEPDAVAPHVDPVVSDAATAVRTAVLAADAATPDGDGDDRTGGRRPGGRPQDVVAGLRPVIELAETHPEATVEAARWADLHGALSGVGPEAAAVAGPLLDAAEGTDQTAVRALLLRLTAAVASEREWAPSTAGEILDRAVAVAAAADDRRVRQAADRVHRAVETTPVDTDASEDGEPGSGSGT